MKHVVSEATISPLRMAALALRVATDFLFSWACFRVERPRRRWRTRGRDESGPGVRHHLDCSRPGDCGAGADRAAPTRPGERALPGAQEPRASANLRTTQGNALPRERSGIPRPGTIAPHVIGEVRGMRR